MGLAAFNLKRRKLALAKAAEEAAAKAKAETPAAPAPAATTTETAGGGAGGQTLVSTNGGPAVPPASTSAPAGGEPLNPAPASLDAPKITAGAVDTPATREAHTQQDPAVPPAISGERPAGADAGTQISGATADGGTVPPALSDADRIAQLAEMTIPEVIEAVKAGKFTREEAAQLEAAGKNRQTLIKRLTESLD